MNDIKFMNLHQFVTNNPAFTLGGMRNYIFYEGVNGLKSSGAIKRIGRKILIDPDRFFEWVSTNPAAVGGINDR